MSEAMEKHVVLLRGINVGGNRKVPMADLRDACRTAGFDDVETYIQSGNIVFTAGNAADAEAAIESIIERLCGFKVEAIARSAKQWAAYAKAPPFADPDDRGNIIHLGLSKRPPADGIADTLEARGKHGEKVVVRGDAIWIDFAEGVRDTKITPAAVDKAAGSTVTMRNWRTVLKIAEMLAG
ncbi:DUF1697 domain-containing protein [Sphingomonas crocodyli]|nr:DUF1697 domain-containing protein [Sphingomonas crocodyli]